MAKRCLTLPWCFAIAVAMACCGFAVGKFLGTLQGAVKLTSVSMRARTAADSILDVGKEVAARNDAALFRRFLDDAYGFFMVYMNDENEERRRTAVDEWQDKYGGLRRQNVVPPSAEEIVREERRARLPSALCGLAFPVIPAFERRFSLLGVQGSVTAEDSECGKHFVKVVITRHCSRFEDNAYNEGVENLGE